MGYRTVVILNNDMQWNYDADLGKKIAAAAAALARGRGGRFESGSVVEQEHADCYSLYMLDSLHAEQVAEGHWYSGQTDQQREIDLLQKMAARHGYSLSKQSV